MFPYREDNRSRKVAMANLEISFDKAFEELVKYRNKYKQVANIQAVYQNGETIAVKFTDGEVITSTPMEGDSFDAHTGVAMCLAKKYLGSRAEFKRLVENINVQS